MRSLHPPGKKPKPKWHLYVLKREGGTWMYYKEESPSEESNEPFLLTLDKQLAADMKSLRGARNVGAHLIREGHAVGIMIRRDPRLP